MGDCSRCLYNNLGNDIGINIEDLQKTFTVNLISYYYSILHRVTLGYKGAK